MPHAKLRKSGGVKLTLDELTLKIKLLNVFLSSLKTMSELDNPFPCVQFLD
jgi:hypothetical protein